MLAALARPDKWNNLFGPYLSPEDSMRAIFIESLLDSDEVTLEGEIYETESYWDCIVDRLANAYRHGDGGNVCIRSDNPINGAHGPILW